MSLQYCTDSIREIDGLTGMYCIFHRSIRLLPCIALFMLHIASTTAAVISIAPGPSWYPNVGTANFATPVAACKSPQFARHYGVASNDIFDHIGPLDGGDQRFWCWFYIRQNDEVQPITAVIPVCPAGSQLTGPFQADGKGYSCICKSGSNYVVSTQKCVAPDSSSSKSAFGVRKPGT